MSKRKTSTTPYLKVQFRVIGKDLQMQVLEQRNFLSRDGEDSRTFKALNGMFVESCSEPSINGIETGTIYVRGEDLSADDNVVSWTFATKGKALAYRDRAIAAIKDFNQRAGDPDSEWTVVG